MPGNRGSENPRHRCLECHASSANLTLSCRSAAPAGLPRVLEEMEMPQHPPQMRAGRASKLSCRIPVVADTARSLQGLCHDGLPHLRRGMTLLDETDQVPAIDNVSDC